MLSVLSFSLAFLSVVAPSIWRGPQRWTDACCLWHRYNRRRLDRASDVSKGYYRTGRGFHRTAPSAVWGRLRFRTWLLFLAISPIRKFLLPIVRFPPGKKKESFLFSFLAPSRWYAFVQWTVRRAFSFSVVACWSFWCGKIVMRTTEWIALKPQRDQRWLYILHNPFISTVAVCREGLENRNFQTRTEPLRHFKLPNCLHICIGVTRAYLRAWERVPFPEMWNFL